MDQGHCDRNQAETEGFVPHWSPSLSVPVLLHLHTFLTNDDSFSFYPSQFYSLDITFFLSPALNLPRYKFLVQVVIGEQKGAGVRMGCRCFWDDQTDSVASETYVNVCRVTTFNTAPMFLNLFGDPGEAIPYSMVYSLHNGVPLTGIVAQQESLFCAVSAFGVYLY